MYDTGDGWVHPQLLRTLTPAPPRLIEQPGGRLVTVSNALGSSPHEHHPAVLLAWARIPDGAWASLMVWHGSRIVAGRERASARWSWVRFEPSQVTALRPWLPDQPRGLRWFGAHAGDHMEAAYLEAAASLPEPMREAALIYTPGVGPSAS